MAQNQNNHGDKQASGKRGFATDHELASEAGRKGGQASHGGGGAKQNHSEVASGKGSDPNNFANDRQKASEAGRKGGQHP
jgi:general stress protein YciG